MGPTIIRLHRHPHSPTSNPQWSSELSSSSSYSTSVSKTYMTTAIAVATLLRQLRSTNEPIGLTNPRYPSLPIPPQLLRAHHVSRKGRQHRQVRNPSLETQPIFQSESNRSPTTAMSSSKPSLPPVPLSSTSTLPGAVLARLLRLRSAS